MAYKGKFIDRSPSLRPAGILCKRKEGDVVDCLAHEVTEEAPLFVCKTGPLDYQLPPKRINIYKGFYSDMQECLQPEVNKSFADVLTNELQDTMYASYWKTPLGRVADQTPMMPAGMDFQNVCFGKATPKETTARELVNPDKSHLEVMEQYEVGHEMYRQTHNDYDPGEQTCRGYLEPFDPNLVWGKTTPCDPQGGCVKKVMTTEDKDKLLVSKVLADHRKRIKSLLGKVWAPNENISRVPIGHAFGRLNIRGLYGVGELMKDCPLSLDKLELHEQLSHINVLRQQISKRQPSFPHRDFVDAFHRIDYNNTGFLQMDDAYGVLENFRIFPDKALFQGFLERANILTKSKTVSYQGIADILNVNVLFPDIPSLEDVPSEFLRFETTSQAAQKYHCSTDLTTTDKPRAGVPPGGHVSMGSLVSPSLFTTYGLKPKDFFVSKSPEYLRSLVDKVGLKLDDNEFREVWEAAKDERGCVCVQSFLDAYKLKNKR